MVAPREFTVAGEYRYDQRTPLHWVRAHIMRYPLLPFLALLGTLIGNICYSLAAVLVGRSFDLITRLGGQAGGVLQPAPALLWLALAIAGAYLVMGMAGILSAFGFEMMAQRVERDIRDELYISLLGKSQTFHNRQRVGDIMARATNDVQQINLMINPGANLIIDSSLAIVVPLFTIALLRLELVLVPLAFLAVFILAVRHYTTELTPITSALREQFGTMNAGLSESLSGIEVVKAYAQETQEKRRFSQHAQRYRDLFVQEGYVKARYLPLLLFGIAYGVAFGHALLLFLRGAVTVGEIVAFMTLVGLLRFPTFISLFSFSLMQLGIAGAERILALLRARTELDENVGGVSQPIRGEVVFEHVTFGYNGAPILKDISFTAQPGETIAIVGQTGAGKTTLTRLVNRIYDVSAGRVLIDGIDVKEWSLQALRSQISTIDQDIFLFSRTLADNIAFGAAGNATREQIEQAGREAQAHDFITSFPHGYNTMVGERGVTLSGGQRQRIAIARAFLTNPRILILDDSTSAIDSATEDQIQHAMRQILHGRTTLLITHRISQIRWADRILVLRNGELVAQGSHQELIVQSEAYRRIFARYQEGDQEHDTGRNG